MRCMASKYSSVDEMIELCRCRRFVSLLTKMSQIWIIFKFSGPRAQGVGAMGSEPGPLEVPTPGTPSENEQCDLYFDDAKYLALFQKRNIFPLSYPAVEPSGRKFLLKIAIKNIFQIRLHNTVKF